MSELTEEISQDIMEAMEAQHIPLTPENVELVQTEFLLLYDKFDVGGFIKADDEEEANSRLGSIFKSRRQARHEHKRRREKKRATLIARLKNQGKSSAYINNVLVYRQANRKKRKKRRKKKQKKIIKTIAAAAAVVGGVALLGGGFIKGGISKITGVFKTGGAGKSALDSIKNLTDVSGMVQKLTGKSPQEVADYADDSVQLAMNEAEREGMIEEEEIVNEAIRAVEKKPGLPTWAMVTGGSFLVLGTGLAIIKSKKK